MLEQPCPTCGQLLDINDDICPACGLPRRRRHVKEISPLVGWVVVLVCTLGGFLFGLMTGWWFALLSGQPFLTHEIPTAGMLVGLGIGLLFYRLKNRKK
ncbi:MAG: hypothetical protein ACYDBB_13750 [Armatimonadota bacterium]